MSKKRKLVPSIRSSAAEYLTFVAANGEGGVEVVYADEDVWITQKMMGTLYQVETHTINYHLKKIFTDNELDENSVIRNFRITANDGKNYNAKHYNLSGVIAKEHAESEFEKYRIVQDGLYVSDSDRQIKQLGELFNGI